MAVPGFVVLLVWISICLSQLKLRRSYPVQPSFRVWGFPYITILATVSLSVIAVLFLFDRQNVLSIGACLAFLLFLYLWSLAKFKKNRR
ncbi:hypothetical protein D3C77_277890 [compost metagenome]